MPPDETFQADLDRLAEFVEDVGDELQAEAVDDIVELTVRGDPHAMTGHRCSRGENRYVVAGHPALRFVIVAYVLSLTENIGAELDEGVAEAIADAEVDDEAIRETAAEQLLDDVPRSQMRSLQSYCYQFVSGSSHQTTMMTNERGSFTTYIVSRDIYPYEETFGIQDFADATRAVVSAGERGSRLLGGTVVVNVDPEAPAQSEIELNFGW